MLVELNIKNFAIIEDINVYFDKGLNILTGETGSGKSIIIEALGIILGGRGSKDLVQKGKNRAILQALFYLEDNLLMDKLKKEGIEVEEDRLLLITREIPRTGPSISKINGSTVTLNILRDISDKIIDIFAQQEHQSLLDKNNHIKLIDLFGNKKFHLLKEEVYSLYSKYKLTQKKYSKANIDSQKREREIDLLNFQIEEIEEANLSLDEDLKLFEEYELLSNYNNIYINLTESSQLLDSDEYESDDILTNLNHVITNISDVSKYDDNLDIILNRMETINLELQDLNMEIKDYINSIDYDNEKLFYLEKRLDLINNLKKKYGDTIEEILEYKNKIEDRLNLLKNLEEHIEKLKNELKIIESQILEKSKELSDYRKKIAIYLQEEVSNELNDLNMENVNFKVDLKKTKELTSTGYDDLEFLISTNLGEDLKPLINIVSGGEMSRIMLAFKSILSKHDAIPTLVFDEIDTGISGRTAQIVGEKIVNISKYRQIVVITHLPQIAALGDSHYLISKSSETGKVISDVRKLNKNERIDELSRLLGGVNVTETTKKHAIEMLDMSNRFKDELIREK